MIWFLPALAGITFEPDPVVGVEVVLTVTHDDKPARGETVRVVHHAGTSNAHERAVGITDARGRARWTPELPGVFELHAGDQVQQGRIPWTQPPAEAVLLLMSLFLGAIGFVLLGLRRTRSVI